jgi:hypothetical protein
MLYFQMRQASKWQVYKASGVCGGRRMRLIIHMWLQGGGKVFLTLCSGAVSYMMRRVLTISKRTRLQLKSGCVRPIWLYGMQRGIRRIRRSGRSPTIFIGSTQHALSPD